MAMKKINYSNKTSIIEDPAIENVNKIQASDMNEIKKVVNDNADAYDNDVLNTDKVSSSDKTIKDIQYKTLAEFETLVSTNSLIPGTDYFILDGGGIAATSSTPVGCGILWFGKPDKIPANFMLPEGQVVRIADYPTLFDRYGYSHTPTGTTPDIDYFYLPNLKGKVVVHLDSAQTEFNTLGKIGGEKSNTLATSNLPRHQHMIRSHYDDANYNSLTIPSTHPMAIPTDTGIGNYPNARWSPTMEPIYTGFDDRNFLNGPPTAVTQTAHNNLQPYVTAYYIIKVREEAYTEDLYNLDAEVKRLNSKSIMRIGGGSDIQVTTNGWAQVAYTGFTNTGLSIGGGFERVNSTIKVVKDISFVRVSALVNIDLAGQGTQLHVRKNGVTLLIVDQGNLSGMCCLSYPELVVDCKKGDIFDIAIGASASASFLSRPTRGFLQLEEI